MQEADATKNSRPEIKRPPVLFAETQRLISQVEDLVHCPILCYWNSTDGSVCHNDVNAFYELFEKIGARDRVALFIKSGGGNVQSSLRIINLIRRYTSHLTAMIPLECASAATMLALGADLIEMGPMAYLTAIDSSVTHSLAPLDRDNCQVAVSLDELLRVLKLWESSSEKGGGESSYSALFPYVHPLVIGAVDRHSSLSIKLCSDILRYHMDDQAKIDEIAGCLNSAYPSHGYPVVLDEACRIGLKAHPLAPEINTILLDLNELYSEMGQRAQTDFDESNHHSNEILNIVEAKNTQIFYQTDQDWHYRGEERRWVSLNNESSWVRHDMIGDEIKRSRLHIR